jgi:phosphohistidine phosphatase SixA
MRDLKPDLRRALARRIWLLAALLLAGCAVQDQQVVAPTTLARPPTAAPAATISASPTQLPPTQLPPSLTAAPPTATPSPPPSPTAAPPTATPDRTAPLEGQPLVDALRRGGYVIYFRHAATDQTQTDRDLSRCETQRNLNEQGRAEARAIGQAFRALNIPIGQVLSSGYCRARDTAQLAFGRAEIVRDISGLPAADRDRRAAALRRLLGTPPPAGTNTVIVSHGFNITAAANISIAEGEAAIFAPGVEEGFALVARVLPGDWAALVEAAATSP